MRFSETDAESIINASSKASAVECIEIVVLVNGTSVRIITSQRERDIQREKDNKIMQNNNGNNLLPFTFGRFAWPSSVCMQIADTNDDIRSH